ncbi:MAG: arsenate reductase ArsC [Rhodospirillaceae bacterium]|nr:arsenate reductase ArsC [Rhodospirillaceae bacterium]
MADTPKNVLFLCTGNSARSILAEALLTHRSAGRFKGFSAGSHPKSEPHPLALELLREMGIATVGFRSKSWDEFAKPGAPHMNFIFTVCDNAAGEVCPIWLGHPATAHWGLPDPAAATGTPAELMQAFRDAARIIDARIGAFLALDFENLSAAALKQKIAEAGQRLP